MPVAVSTCASRPFPADLELAELIDVEATDSPDHHRRVKLERAFGAYAKRTGHKFTPDEYRSILQLGITVPEKHLSKKAEKGRKETIEDAFKGGAQQLGKLIGT